jgi:signal transduction histidine kinase
MYHWEQKQFSAIKSISKVALLTHILSLGLSIYLLNKEDLMNPLPLFALALICSAIGFQIFSFFKAQKAELEVLRKNAEVTLENEKKLKSLQSQERFLLLSQITGGIAHEINNPLSIIVGYAENIQSLAEEKSVEHNRYFNDAEKILKATERAASIIKSLRRLSRDGSLDPFEPMPIKTLIRENFTYFKSQLMGAGIRTEIEGDDPVVFCQPGEISQVLLNLISNSIDAIENLPEKWIRVRVTQLEEQIQITFTDSGKGIAENIQKKIMEPFFTTKEVGKGTGLGLSMSNSIVEAHGGSFSLDTQSVHTSFVISLPLHIKPAAVA